MQPWINSVNETLAEGKVIAFVWYSVASRWFLLSNILLYLACCYVAGRMVGPIRFIEFLYHCAHWKVS